MDSGHGEIAASNTTVFELEPQNVTAVQFFE